MQEVVLTCNRCGKVIERTEGYFDKNNIKFISGRIQYWPIGEPRSYPGQRLELCEDCNNSFVNWLDKGG